MAFSQAGGAGAQALARSAALMNQYRGMSTAPNVFNMGREGHANERFPVQLSTTDPEDQKWAMREKIVQQDGTVANIGKAIAPSEYFDYAQRKENADLLFQFQQFVLQQVDLSTPEAANWWYTKFPWIREAKLKELHQQADLQKRYAEIAITGPQNEEDFLLIWMRKNGLIKVSDQPLERLWADESITSRSYRDGFFSPLAKQIPPTDIRRGGTMDWSNPVSEVFTPSRIPVVNSPANIANVWTANPRGA